MVELMHANDRRYTRRALSGSEDQSGSRKALDQGIDFARSGRRSWKARPEKEATGGFAADPVEAARYARGRQ